MFPVQRQWDQLRRCVRWPVQSWGIVLALWVNTLLFPIVLVIVINSFVSLYPLYKNIPNKQFYSAVNELIRDPS